MRARAAIVVSPRRNAAGRSSAFARLKNNAHSANRVEDAATDAFLVNNGIISSGQQWGAHDARPRRRLLKYCHYEVGNHLCHLRVRDPDG